jgi:superfamily I DNA/RNA helicase
METPGPSPEWKASHWLARESMSRTAITAALDLIASNTQQPPARARVARREELRARLFGEFSRVPVIDAQRGAVLDEQNVATEGQARVLAGLARNPRIMVLGGAGTGKSLVLAEAAKQEASAGRSVLITFQSPGLLHFFRELVAYRGIDVIPFSELTGSTRYDVLFVDEAQDLMSADAMDILDRILPGGCGAGRWRMFLDQNNQAHVDGRYDPSVFDLVRSAAIEYDLSLNVRNTKSIVHMVQDYLGADIGDPGIVFGERIQWRWVAEGAGVSESLLIAKAMIAEGVRPATIWVIPVTADIETDEFCEGVRVLSPRVAKGLETEHVIVCDLPRKLNDQALANLYVSLTRPRVTLHIVATDADKKRLQELARKRER